ncbi:DASH family cryptochrome [Mucilaginibacter xinganensis]|uniref:Cryptochrome DASH n=1 Tax=Mucilaginibacter xinganensis TaxID=1234841 RepID=A0A223P274_9SPHI|nr:DASH family cryptochrome [Mucilaginibacter xinganensis]ASU35928.1 deoxyribodipyrimidine photolyase [Mucilaginibacter xinganensis]
MSEKTILVWFRNDLRIHDNEILLEAVRKADKVLPVYCFDPFYFKHNPSGNPKTGNIRTRFLLESVANLRKNLKSIGGELIVRIGNPAEIIPGLAEEYQVSEVYHHREVAHEETEISEQVETALWKIKLNLKHFIGHTLYHKEDLPFPIKDIPDSFAVFKKKVERDSNVRQCVATPEKVAVPVITDAGVLPTLQKLGLEQLVDDIRATMKFKGGEDEALAQLHDFFLNNCHVVIGKKGNTINLSKLSPWIALGCISLRQVYWEIIKNQQLNNTHYPGMLLDLLWRDYFRFMFKKHGQKFIAVKNPEDESADVIDGNLLFESWAHGETGVSLVDAIMHELNATGYISNYSRQIVAGFLVNELKVDWKLGAAYFEEKLIDYSPASNWGNWAFIAGVNDARESRYTIAALPTAEQAGKNDYIETWLPAVNRDDYRAYAVK